MRQPRVMRSSAGHSVSRLASAALIQRADLGVRLREMQFVAFVVVAGVFVAGVAAARRLLPPLASTV